jgi:hypothetical protein
MKRKMVIIALSVIMVLSIANCASTSNVGSYPGIVTEIDSKDYEILGDVDYEGKWSGILGFEKSFLFQKGGAKYIDLYKVAKERYNADEVINISIDYDDVSYAFFYASKTYIMHGLAIKYK